MDGLLVTETTQCKKGTQRGGAYCELTEYLQTGYSGPPLGEATCKREKFPCRHKK
jgi:hypothetical protein